MENSRFKEKEQIQNMIESIVEGPERTDLLKNFIDMTELLLKNSQIWYKKNE